MADRKTWPRLEALSGAALLFGLPLRLFCALFDVTLCPVLLGGPNTARQLLHVLHQQHMSVQATTETKVTRAMKASPT